MIIDRRNFLVGSLAAAGVTGIGLPLLPEAAGAQPSRPRGQNSPSAPLSNLGHLDFLRTEVQPPTQSGHTTYRLDTEPAIGVLWVYANYDNGTYTPTGGGNYDATNNTYGQGAFDADDMSRAAVVYVRHWVRFGDDHSRQGAYDLLRGLTYLQTSSGPNAGNVVLWMQPDGTLNPTPTPPDSPNPSDSGPSWWLGRTLWALGEGYAAFRSSDPAFASFLQDRFELALSSLENNVLNSYGTYLDVNGQRIPSWLLTGGADASSEACLGLLAYARATGDPRTTTALHQLATGVAAMASRPGDQWLFGAFRPDATDLSLWHAYGDQPAGVLASAAGLLDDPDLLRPAVNYGASFAPHLIVQGGPDNEWLPAPVAAPGQISYGAYSVFADLIALAAATGQPGYTALAGFAASWWFGNNVAGAAMYNPASGVCFDGVSITGVNQNSGAESTICAQLAMIDLDTEPDVAAAAQIATLVQRVSWQQLPASSADLSGSAALVTGAPSSAESQWSGSYASLQPSGQATTSVTLPVKGRYRVFTVTDRTTGPDQAAGTDQQLGGVDAGTAWQGGLGPQGSGAYPDELVVTAAPLTTVLPTGPAALVSTYAGTGAAAALNAWLVQPEVESLVLSGAGGTRALLRSSGDTPTYGAVAWPADVTADVSVYDRGGELRRRYSTQGRALRIPVEPAGFSIVQG